MDNINSGQTGHNPISRINAAWNVLFAAIFIPATFSLSHSQEYHGTVYGKTFIGPLTHEIIHYTIYLPANYGHEAKRYPVVYHLHGYGDAFSGGYQTETVPASFENEKSVLGPVIVVCPDGYGSSYWTDCTDSTKHAETNFIHELVPHVDATYRTIADRRHRIIQGFSMGGFGALKFIAKYPDVFSICVAYDGGPYTWPELQSWFPITASAFFGMDEQRFNQNAPMPLAEANARTIKENCGIRMVVGQQTGMNRTMRAFYQNLNISPDYAEAPCSHDLACLLGFEGKNSASFIAAQMAEGTTAIRDDGPDTPKSFLLLRNYPNPFNASTEIHFFLHHPSRVTLKIFDLRGRELAALINGFMPAGERVVIFEADDWPSGVYIYELRTERDKEARKLILLK